MDSRRVQTSLRLIGKIYSDILDASTTWVLHQAVESIKRTKETYDFAKRNKTRGLELEPWGYTIDHNSPLRFQKSEIRDLQVDVYCDVRWEDDDVPVKQNVIVRIWSEHPETIFDPHRDAEEISEKLAKSEVQPPRRVMSRFHFDMVGQEIYKHGRPREYHPEHHVQFGGIPKAYELCWHSEKVDIPRLMHQPMELFLTCQMIAANFFPNKYIEIKNKSEWIAELRFYQELLLGAYYQRCFEMIKNRDSLLDGLCGS